MKRKDWGYFAWLFLELGSSTSESPKVELLDSNHCQYFKKGLCSGDFPGTARQGKCSRFLAERLKSLLPFRDVLIVIKSPAAD